MARSRIVNLANFEQFTAVNVLSDPGYSREKLVIPNACQVTLDWTLADGKLAHNVLYANIPPAFTPTAAIADNLLIALTSGAAWTGFAAVLSASTTLSAITLRDVRSADQPLVTSVGTGHPGTDAAVALPNEVALVVTLRTAKAGRGFRGRMYLPGFGSDQVTAGNLVAAGCITAVTAWVGLLATEIQTIVGTWSLGLRHRVAYTSGTGTTHDDRPAQLVQITAAPVRDNHWDSQRRRGLK
jgi:hypothetical protein